MKTLVVYNPKSGSANTKALRAAFAEAGVAATFTSISSRDLEGQIKLATTVVAAGGDGTINAVVTCLIDTKKRLGILPLGTLNHFAKELDIPLGINEAVRVIAAGKVRGVDVGEVNGHVFVNNSSIGIYPRSLRMREEYEKSFGKWPAAIWGLLRSMVHPRHYRVELRINDVAHTFRTPFVFIANNEYKRSRVELGTRRSLDAGLLAIYAIKTTHPLKTAYALVRMFITKKYRTRDFAIHLTDSCSIHARHHDQLRIACDGEVFKVDTPLHYKSKTRALNVIAR